MDEFELIARFLTGLGARRDDVVLGVGDDAAVLAAPPDRELLLTTDTLVAGRHFPESFPPRALGHRALAASLSDIAAMGGEAAWALLALSLPEAAADWLAEFADGFAALAERNRVALVGGNVARGPLSLTVTIAGLVVAGEAMKRSGARAGDSLFVTGALGGGAAGLRAFVAGEALDSDSVCGFSRPEPRLLAGHALAAHAHAAIDISDGLVGDLAKLLAASGGLGAELDSEALPLASSATLADALGPSDDYELLFAVPASAAGAIALLRSTALHCPMTKIGNVVARPGIRLDGDTLADEVLHGYRHFA